MNKTDLLREIVEKYKGFSWYANDFRPLKERKNDLYCEVGSELFYSDNKEEEVLARQIFEKARWPEGAHCPRCGHEHISRLRNQHKFECAKCEYQFSLTSGTVFHGLRVPMRVLVGFIALSEAFRWRRGTKLYLSKLNPAKEDVHNPISWPTACRLWRLARKPEWDTCPT